MALKSIQIPLVLGTDEDFSKRANDSKLLNLFVHLQSPGSKNKYIILNTSGLKLTKSIPNEQIKGLYSFKDVLYVVTSCSLKTLDVRRKELITIVDNISVKNYCRFADNGNEIVFTGGYKPYSYNPFTGKLSIVDAESDSVAFIDGRFIFNKRNTGRIYASDLYSTNIDPLSFATAESNSDNLLSVNATTRELWLFGEKSIEVWYNAGTVGFPFAKISGAVSNIGIIKGSDVLLRDSIYFIGNDYKVYETSGYSVKPISTPGVTKAIEDNKDEKIHAFSFIEYGHYFYCITIGAVITYVYDVTTMQWHTRRSSTGNVWRVKGMVNHKNKTVCFDNINIYDMSINYYDEDGENVKREIRSLPINKGTDRVRVMELQLDMEVGIGLDKMPYINLLAMYMQTTRNGGMTWSGRYGASIGKIGENRTRVRWSRLGQFTDVIAKIYTYAPVPIRIIQLTGRIVV